MRWNSLKWCTARADVGDAAEHPLAAETLIQRGVVRDPVQERQHAGFRVDRGRDGIERAPQVIGLRREEHQIVAGLDLVLSHAANLEFGVAVPALDAQALALDRLSALRAHEEGHLRPFFRQAAAEIAADAAGAQNQDLHAFFSPAFFPHTCGSVPLTRRRMFARWRQTMRSAIAATAAVTGRSPKSQNAQNTAKIALMIDASETIRRLVSGTEPQVWGKKAGEKKA
jgi:hypothetical protein